MKAMMLAAGLGTRMRPHSLYLPKPAIPFMGIPLALYPSYLAQKMGVTEFIFNSHHLPETLEASIKPFFQQQNIPLRFLFEKEILGSGGGVKNAEKYLKEEPCFLVYNADEVILPLSEEQLHNFITDFKASNSIASFYCMEHHEVGTRFGGVWVNEKLEVRGFGKQAFLDAKKAYHFTGLSIYSSEIFNYLQDGVSNILYDAVSKAIESGEKAKAFVSENQWFELGNPEEFFNAHDKILGLWNSDQSWAIKECILKFAPKDLKQQLLSWNGQFPVDFGNQEAKNKDNKNWNFLLTKDTAWATKQLDSCIVLGESIHFPDAQYSRNILKSVSK